MEQLSMQALLLADEEKLRNRLRADASIDKSRDRSIADLEEELGSVLLRYNAACAPDRMRQSLADCLAATARDALGLLKAAGAEKEEAKRETSAGASLLLPAGVILAAAGVLLIGRFRLAGILCIAAAVIVSFLSGRLWFKAREVTVRPTLDPESLWAGLRRSCETMDRKIEEFSDRSGDWLPAGGGENGSQPLGEEELQLFGDLLEALYADNGDFALRQLKKLLPCLRGLGIEAVDYHGDNAELFELFPSRRSGATLRPALLAGDRLLLAGRATERTD